MVAPGLPFKPIGMLAAIVLRCGNVRSMTMEFLVAGRIENLNGGA